MGACAGKGSSPKDPDKEPYGPPKASKKGKKQAASAPAKKQTTSAEADDDRRISTPDAAPEEDKEGTGGSPKTEVKKEPEALREPPVPAPRVISPVVAASTTSTPKDITPSASPQREDDEEEEEKGAPVAPIVPSRDYRFASGTSQDCAASPLSKVIPVCEPAVAVVKPEPRPRQRTPSPPSVEDEEIVLRIVESGDEDSPSKPGDKKGVSTTTSTTTTKYEYKKPFSKPADHEDAATPDPQSIIQSVRAMSKDTSSSSTVVKETKTTVIQSSSSVEKARDETVTEVKSVMTSVEKDGDIVIRKTSSMSDGKTPGSGMALFDALKPLKDVKPVSEATTATSEATSEKIVVMKTTITTSNHESSGEVRSPFTRSDGKKSPTSPTSPTSKLPVFAREGDTHVGALDKQPTSPKHVTPQSPPRTTIQLERHEGVLNNNSGELIAKPTSPPIVANVLITNGDSPTKEAPVDKHLVEIKDAASKSFSSATSESTIEDDVNAADETITPVLQINLKKVVQSALLDFSATNDAIRKRHKYQANTRAKLMGCIERWITGQDKEPKSSFRSLWGSPGMGKTCMACDMCNRHASRVAAVHFFHHCSPNLDHNDPSSVIMSLAYQLCEYFPNYPNMLPNPDKLEDLAANGNVTELWQALIIDPLHSEGLNHDPDKFILIVMDSLEDCGLQERDIFFQLLNNFADSTPEWAHLMVTVNDDNQIRSQVEKAYAVELSKRPDNLADIKRYLRDYMSPFMDRISLDGGLTQLAKNTEGNFLCASLFAKNLEAIPKDTKIALREVDSMFPTGLSATLTEIFQALFDHLSEMSSERQAQNVYDTLLGILINIKEPLHEDFISDVTDLELEGILEMLDPVIAQDKDKRICFHHRYIRDWLCNEQESGQLVVGAGSGRQVLQECCAKWLAHITGDADRPTANHHLQSYALKHAISHFTDVPRQQESVARLLCSLKYIQQKLSLDDVSIYHMIGDYKHYHYQILRDTVKMVTLEEYMKRQPKLVEQMDSYQKFVQQKGADIKQSPDFTLNVAANYPSVQRIQANARLELEGKAWIEDLTAVPESQCTTKSFGGTICGIDISPDNKTVALVTKDDDYNLLLHFINASTAEKRSEPIDIKTLKDRVGLCTKFLNDNNNVFVGSLTTVVSTRGKVAPSGFDLETVDLKQKFSIECCDVSGKSLACGISTFPWGGRSLHMILFDLKTKKCTQTLEVLKFRFGGSAQFGIRCCSLSKNDSLLCTCVKQTNKEQLKVSIWSTSTWTTLHSIDLDGDSFTKCSFVGDSGILCGGSVHIANKQQSGPLKSKVWQYKSSTGNSVQDLNQMESHSSFDVTPAGRVICSSWSVPKGHATISSWKDGMVTGPSNSTSSVRGLDSVMDMVTFGDYLMFVTSDEVRLYNAHDLDSANRGSVEGASVGVNDVTIESICFLPRSDEVMVTNHFTFQSNKVLSVSKMNPKQEEMSFAETPFKNEARSHFLSGDRLGQFSSFTSPGSTRELCATSADGNSMIFNAGDKVKVWNKSSGPVFTLPEYQELADKEDSSYNQYKGITSMASPKDNIIGLVYGQMPHCLYLYDLKSKQMLRKLKLDTLDSPGGSALITDFTFLPHNGYVVSYHRDAQRTLSFWNQKTGVQMSFVQCVHIGYAKASPASDRMAISVRRSKQEGELVLRNSDGRFNAILDMPGTWLPTSRDSDVDFSSDGTILVGVACENNICRVWNAGNGEVLQDMSIDLQGPTSVVGMLTNTHVLLHDDRLIVADIATGNIESVLPLDEIMERNTSRRGLRISPKGNYVVGATDQGQLKVFLCHNFAAIKRKTTLQRMKSISK